MLTYIHSTTTPACPMCRFEIDTDVDADGSVDTTRFENAWWFALEEEEDNWSEVGSAEEEE